MKKTIYRMILAAVLSAAMVSTVFAETPEFGRTAEEWALLRDNTLEYAEIPALVEEYNADYLAKKNENDNSDLSGRNADATANRLESMANTYESMAAEAEDTSGTQAAAYYMQAETLRTQAADHVSDSRTMNISLQRVRCEIEKETKELFFEYYRTLKKQAFAAQELEYLQKAYTSAQTRHRYGAGTEIEELAALEALQKAQSGQITLNAELSAIYKRLITLCGWKYDSQAVIGAEPAADPQTILPADPENDRKQALENSLTLRADAILLENARNQGRTTEDKYRRQQDTDMNTVKTGFTSAYDALLQKKSAYDTKAAQYELKAQQLSLSARQLSLGLIARMEYAAAENGLNAARTAMEDAWYDLMEARVAYDAAVSGVL